MIRIAVPFWLSLPGLAMTLVSVLDQRRVPFGVLGCAYLGPLAVLWMAEGDLGIRSVGRSLRDFAYWTFHGQSPACARCEGSGTELLHSAPTCRYGIASFLFAMGLGAVVAFVLFSSVSRLAI